MEQPLLMEQSAVPNVTKKKPVQKRPRLPPEVNAKRRARAIDLFRQGQSINEVHSTIIAEFERPLNWRTYRRLEAIAQGLMPDDNFTPIPEPMPAPKAKPKLKQAPKPAPPPKEPKIAVSVQPMKQVSQKLLLKLQTVVNEMQKGGIDKLIVDRAGSIQVTFAPVEQMFDLEQG